MLRVLAYIWSVSTDGAGDKPRRDAADQTRRITEWAKRQDADTPRFYTEPSTGDGGETLTELIDVLAPGDCLVVTSLSADLPRTVSLLAQVERAGARLVALDEGLDLDPQQQAMAARLVRTLAELPQAASQSPFAIHHVDGESSSLAPAHAPLDGSEGLDVVLDSGTASGIDTPTNLPAGSPDGHASLATTEGGYVPEGLVLDRTESATSDGPPTAPGALDARLTLPADEAGEVLDWINGDAPDEPPVAADDAPQWDRWPEQEPPEDQPTVADEPASTLMDGPLEDALSAPSIPPVVEDKPGFHPAPVGGAYYAPPSVPRANTTNDAVFERDDLQEGTNADYSKVAEQASRFARKGKIAKAIRLWTDFGERATGETAGRACNQLSDLYARTGQIGRAVEQLNESARYFEMSGYYERAAAALRKIRKLIPDHADIYLQLAELNGRAGQVGDAVEAYLTYAGHLVRDGRTEQALAIFQHIRVLDPVNPRHRLQIAAELFEFEFTDAAVQETLYAAELLVLERRIDEAVAHLSRTLERCPGRDDVASMIHKLTHRAEDAYGGQQDEVSEFSSPSYELEDVDGEDLSFLEAVELPRKGRATWQRAI